MNEQGINVLLVESDKNHADQANQAFASHGDSFRLAVRDSLKKALRYVADFSPHLVITNLVLPDGTGLKLLTAEGNPKRIPVLVMADREDDETAREAQRAGALSCVVKTEDALRQLPAIAKRVLQGVNQALEGKLAQDALRQSEMRNRAILSAIPDLLFRVGQDGTFLDCVGAKEGPVAEYAQFVSRKLEEVLPVEVVPRTRRALQKALRTGKIQVLELELPAAGGVRVCEIRMVAGGEREVVAIFRDVTDRRNREEEARRAQKVKAIGSLVGAITHEFNNVLTGIMVQTDLMLMKLDRGDPLYDMADEIRRISVRAATTVLMLQAFSGTQEFAPKILDLNELVVRMKKTIRLFVGEEVALGDHLGADLGQVNVDPSHIQHIILTLAADVRGTAAKGMTFTVRTANVTFERADPAGTGEIPAGHYVLLSVSNAGIKAGEDSQRLLVEPEATAAKPGEASDPDPVLIPGIVELNGGVLRVYGHPRGGKTYEIYFPRVEPEGIPRAEEPRSPAFETIRRGEEVVLLVEDNDMVMRALASLLQKEGYTVLEARDGEEALRVSGKSEVKIHLMVSDVKMPNLGGLELAEQLSSLNPDMRVLFISGYPKETLFPKGVVDFGKAFLPKPFTREGLLRKVRQVLDTPVKGGGLP